MEYKSSLQQEIINVLHYFDVFHFPLRFDEIHQFIQYKCTTEELSEALTDLVANQSVYQFNNIYSLKSGCKLYYNCQAFFEIGKDFYRLKISYLRF